MSWSLTGSYFETCSCDLMCPCNMSMDHGATHDYCRVTLVFNIKQGEIEGTDVAGASVAVIADTPKVMTEGNWRLGFFIDDGASDEQVEKLTAVFSGQKGGPMENAAALIGEVAGVERAPFEVVEDGLTHSVKIGDAIDFEIEDIVPFGAETASPSGSSAWSTRPARSSMPRRQSARRSTRSGSSTRARLESRRRSSPGPPEGLGAAGAAGSSVDQAPFDRPAAQLVAVR